MELNKIKQIGIDWLTQMMKTRTIMTKPGSITYLLYGQQISEQSINIKFGYLGEILIKNIVKCNTNLKLLDCGVQKIIDSKLDVDLIWLNENNKTIYIREIKANINLDTEKTNAIIHKLNNIFLLHFKKVYPEYNINVGILTWTIYKYVNINKTKITKFKQNNINVEHFDDFLKLTNFVWEEDDFYKYFKKLGKIIKQTD